MLSLALAPLRFLDRHSRVLLALGVFIGVALPSLASALKPYIIASVLGCLVGAMLLLDWDKIRVESRRRGLLGAFVIWQLLICPVTVWFIADWFGLSSTLTEVVFLQSAAPPIASAAVFLLLLGIDGGLALLVSVFCVLLLPVTLTALMGIFLATALEVSLWEFFARACVMLLMPFIIAWGVRRWFGKTRLQQASGAISGLNVLLLIVFAIGVMDGVYVEFVDRTDSAVRLFITAWVMAVILHVAGFAAFSRVGRYEAMTAAMTSGNRNLGVMFAVAATVASSDFALYVGIAQIPMYFVPLLLAPLAKRLHLESRATR